jgi:EAL domain-containing protein (putative c-di-GMP-specific phosphodiesterase class I)
MQLRQLPFTEVKIDQFFVNDAVTSKDSRLIVTAIVDLAHGLGLTVTAEGVETREQLQLLLELGCDVAQGYLIAHPLEPDGLADWKHEFRTRWWTLIEYQRLALWGDVEPDSLG